jgi:hypothetical protein
MYYRHLQGEGVSQARSRQEMETHLAGFLLGLLVNPEDESNSFIENIDELIPYYTALHPRKFQSSQSPLSEPQI